MKMHKPKLIVPKFTKLSLIGCIGTTMALVGFAVVLLLGAFKEGVDVVVHIGTGVTMLGIWFLLMIVFSKKYYYLNIKYCCTTEAIVNSIYKEDRTLSLIEGVFCTCIPVKFHMRYGYVTEKLYILSDRPLDRDLNKYSGADFIRKIWKDKCFLMPVNPSIDHWIEILYGCKKLADFPKVTYLPGTKDKRQGDGSVVPAGE